MTKNIIFAYITKGLGFFLNHTSNNVVSQFLYIRIKSYAGRSMMRRQQVDKGILQHQFLL
jgi:hypothetical protein